MLDGNCKNKKEKWDMQRVTGEVGILLKDMTPFKT